MKHTDCNSLLTIWYSNSFDHALDYIRYKCHKIKNKKYKWSKVLCIIRKL